MKLEIIILGISVILMGVMIGCETKKAVNENIPKPYNLEAMYDENQPQPAVITPGTASTQKTLGKIPSDAVVLFDGKGLSQWLDKDGKPAKWKVEKGYMEVVKGTGQIHTKQEFGSFQLHIEWATPTEIVGKGQERGNSGVYLMNLYEVQVLDSYNNKTYPAGMAGSVYGQNPPLVNASLPPGVWQTYDIVFRRPVFKDSVLVEPAIVTVFYNGVLVQDHFEIVGATIFKEVPTYQKHPDKLPLGLQDHGNPVRYRNIWIRELSD